MGEKKKRAEIAFFYDIRDNNPNGDPLSENRPRIDEETEVCFVTDVRLKRTIRNHLRDHFGETILIDEFEKEDGTIKMAKERAEDFISKNANAEPKDLLLDNCIDARLFGCAIPLGEKKKSIQVTGPVQFNYGRSVHKVEDILLQGTAAFAGSKGAKNRSFRQDYIIHYGLFRFYGFLNEYLAENSKMKDEDFDKMLYSTWYGTMTLSSRSKVGHMPRLLVVVFYEESKFFIGQIDKLIKVHKIDPEKPDKALRDISEFEFDVSDFLEKLGEVKSKVGEVRLKVHSDVVFKDGKDLAKELKALGITVKEI
ncbi:MAG: type I-B CRISPR-associated protein Cas7/Csh2 [Promethearchaeota archaeon]